MDILNRNRTALSLLLILLLGASLRGYGILDRGLFDYDEAWYLLEAKTLYNTGRFALARAGLIQDPDAALGLKTYIKQRGTVPLTSIKPGHTAFLFAGLLLFGPYDYAGLLVSVLTGLLTVYLVYRLGREMFGPGAGLLAALCLAVSPFHILYSRAAYAQANGIFMVALGAFLWLRLHSREDRRLSALIPPGLAVGWAFTCHFNIAWVPVTFMLLELAVLCLRPARFPGPGNRARRLLALGGALAAPAATFELTGQFFKWVGVFPADYPTYLGQFAHREPIARALHFSFDQVPFWSSRLLQIEGPFVLALALVGLFLALAKLRRPGPGPLLLWSLLLVALLPPSILAVERHYHMLRNVALLAPSLALLAGLGGAWLVERLSRLTVGRLQPVYYIALCLFIAAGSGLRNRDLLGLRSTYRQATQELMAYMATRGGRLAARPLSAWPLWYFYLSGAYEDAAPELRERIRFYPKTVNEGDYELIDVKSYHRALTRNDRKGLAAYRQLRNLATPVVRVANPAAGIPQKYYEAGGAGTGETRAALATDYPESGTIEIYDLRNLNLPALSSAQSAQPEEQP